MPALQFQLGVFKHTYQHAASHTHGFLGAIAYLRRQRRQTRQLQLMEQLGVCLLLHQGLGHM